ncbi:hypothetical protein MVLG_05818 [Microbotryum lychnidis-dioicae p1A1 Lamole]|uniref:Palmitoyltransferase n=1 Tax=Microbotryum lychnidis-dioicae (strain p1A1 Lamole / MvSl-1064) TaxID=683840 RepID=U5HFE1_USTV1|nr:hypothetical protein MVLG_05818 [Microbotryum lychnidis-dioicae p1A1 Lamole]|eukprot:KDE03687.1 hypothetical protein MVLG_05818 [Microbotryum lychnidis-dioicae p1A1 Lamole]
MAPPPLATKTSATTSATIVEHSATPLARTSLQSTSAQGNASGATSPPNPDHAPACDPTSPTEPHESHEPFTASPPLPQLHHAAQIGDLTALHSLLPEPNDAPSTTATADGAPTVTANDLDPVGVTALHWAAINNHVQACKFLLERGANVDAIGGDLSATPLQWAARNGHVYVVHLLLKYNADPTLLDSQSFNALHLSVHSSSALLVAYMLFTSQPIAVDSADTEGHTSLHWACYQGDAISVDLLLRAGADPRRPDGAGLTPLHWAAVKGNAACIKRLVEAGVDLSVKEHAGKTARDMAAELKSLAAFKRGLLDAGYHEDGRKQVGTLSPRNTIVAIFIVPSLAFVVILQSLVILPWWSGLLLAFGEIYGMHHIVAKVLLGVSGPHNSDRITKSPYLASIITASLLAATYIYLTRMVSLPGHAVSQLLCGIGILVCSYNFFRAITLDPGHVPFPVNDSELKETIEDLVEHGNFNGMNFCLPCLTRRPLRSKHSYMTKRCTARFDHYCPWVWNDVGSNNHRQFLMFVIALVFAISVFLKLSYHYFSTLAPPLPPDAVCNFPNWLCVSSRFDTLALVVVSWSGLQLTWTSILLVAQLWQVVRQMTSLEVSNVGRHGYMGGKPGVSIAAQQGLVATRTAAALATSSTHATVDREVGDEEAVNHKSTRVRKGGFLLKILGIDRFTTGQAVTGLAKSGHVANPFDLGLVGNCRDFWTRGKELDVDYTRLHEIPEGGFQKAVRERRRREREEKAGLKKPGTTAMSTVRGAKANKSGRTGYERLAMDEV